MLRLPSPIQLSSLARRRCLPSPCSHARFLATVSHVLPRDVVSQPKLNAFKARPEVPSLNQLVETAKRFQAWVHRVAPGTRVVICGGVAARLHGGSRMTKDVDTTLDFSRCTTPSGIDVLKAAMRRSPRFAIQGVDTLFHLSPTASVAVDYVDAAVFYFAPHEADALVAPVPGAPALQMLAAPTLLVHKILATQDRPITEPVLRRTKQLADASDARFLVHHCLHTRQLIQPIHARRFQGDARRVLAAFAAVARRVGVCGDQDFAAWNALASASGLGPEFKITNSLSRLEEQDQAQVAVDGRDLGL